MIFFLLDFVVCSQGVSYITSSRDFERKDSEPTDTVLPSTGESPRWINKSDNVHVERSIYRVHDSHLSKSLHHQVSGDIRQHI
jgi:hypothetical protein